MIRFGHLTLQKNAQIPEVNSVFDEDMILGSGGFTPFLFASDVWLEVMF